MRRSGKFLYANVYYHPRVAKVNQRACEMLRKVFESYLGRSKSARRRRDATTRPGRIASHGLRLRRGNDDRYLMGRIRADQRSPMIVKAGPLGGQRMSRFRWAWVAFLIVATSVPYLINWHYAPPGYRYLWILPPDPEDSFAYMAWAEQAARGALLFKIKYTALSQTPFLFHPFFLVCGWLSAILSCGSG